MDVVETCGQSLDALPVELSLRGSQAQAVAVWLRALNTTAAAVAVVVDTGVVTARAVQTAAGGRPVVTVSWSARVARPGARRRVPAELPGRWLSALAPVLVGGRR